MKINLRKAYAHDMQQVHELVFELATFERAPNEVITSAETYIRDGFTENRFEIIVAEDMDIAGENKIIGIAFYFWAYSTWKGKFMWLEDLIVTEKYRRAGIGKLLFDSVVKKALEQNASQLKWQVLDWNENAINFYKKYNAKYAAGWLTYKLTREQLEKTGIDTITHRL